MHRFARALEISVSYFGIAALLFLAAAFNAPTSSFAAVSTAPTSSSSSTCVAPSFFPSSLTPAYMYTPWNQTLLAAFDGPYVPTVTVTGLPPGMSMQDQTTVVTTGNGTILHNWIITGSPTQLGTYIITVTAQNACGGTSMTITLPVNNPTLGTGPAQCPAGTIGTYPICLPGTTATVGFDQASLTTTASTASISGTSNTPSIKLQVQTPGGAMYTTNPVTVVAGRWSVVLKDLKSGTYSLFLYDDANRPLLPATLTVTLAADVVSPTPAPIPWMQPTPVPVPVATTPDVVGYSCAITGTLSVGSRGADVTTLQNALIQRGLLSYGSATGYFGNLTRAAVQQFQAQTGLVSSGNEATTGYGLVGARTRAAILSGCGQTQYQTQTQENTSFQYSTTNNTVQPATQIASCPSVSVPPCQNSTLVSLGVDSDHCSIGYTCKSAGPVCPAKGMPSCTGGYPTEIGKDANGCSLGYQCQTASCPLVPTVTSCPGGQTLVSRTDQYGCVAYSACQ